MTMKLYDLACEDEHIRFSPYCWKVKMALAHKGLTAEFIPWHYLEKDIITPSGQGAVPVLEHKGKMIGDSWAIVEYLEEAFPETVSVFSGNGKSYAYFINTWADNLLLHLIGKMITSDIVVALPAEDQAYYRQTREARWGTRLEELTSDRETKVHGLRDTLEPLRRVLQAQDFLNGDQASYADYAVFGFFMWARVISRFELLLHDDPIYHWRERLLDAFDGFARNAPRVQSKAHSA